MVYIDNVNVKVSEYMCCIKYVVVIVYYNGKVSFFVNSDKVIVFEVFGFKFFSNIFFN